MEQLNNYLVSQPVKEIADQLWTGLIIFTIAIIAVGIAIAVWRIVVLFNSGKRYLKQQKQREEAIRKLKNRKKKHK
ncbi:MAG: hypothetical protein WC275_01885 [Bacilli bacterium]